ncbi:Rpn family recombination-promoting nuclease/putative transposase [Klebsiella aerogenes]|nr:Rpn family recombination-promoting nuclease/putative transposase [Klebsiella aerogenes]
MKRVRATPHDALFKTFLTHPETAREVYGAHFPLIDVTSFTDDEIQQHRRIAILEFLQKNIRQRDLNGLVDQLVTLLLPGYTTEHQFHVLMNYIACSGYLANPGRFFRQLAQGMPEHKEQLMTLAEWFEERGRTKGRKQGLEEGKRQATRKIARAMLLNGVAGELVCKTTGLTAQELSELAH